MKFLRTPKKGKKKNIEIDEKSLKEREDCFNACIDNSIFYTRLALPAAFFMGHLFFLGGVNTFDNILIGLALFSFVFFSTTILYSYDIFCDIKNEIQKSDTPIYFVLGNNEPCTLKNIIKHVLLNTFSLHQVYKFKIVVPENTRRKANKNFLPLRAKEEILAKISTYPLPRELEPLVNEIVEIYRSVISLDFTDNILLSIDKIFENISNVNCNLSAEECTKIKEILYRYIHFLRDKQMKKIEDVNSEIDALHSYIQ